MLSDEKRQIDQVDYRKEEGKSRLRKIKDFAEKFPKISLA
jgi:hypothetical protein